MKHVLRIQKNSITEPEIPMEIHYPNFDSAYKHFLIEASIQGKYRAHLMGNTTIKIYECKPSQKGKDKEHLVMKLEILRT